MEDSFSAVGCNGEDQSSSVKITPTVYFELGISLSKINKFSIAMQCTLQASSGVGIEASASVNQQGIDHYDGKSSYCVV